MKKSYLINDEEITNSNSKIEKLICPVCKKEFIKTERHMYILNNEYACSWECFLDYVKLHPKTNKK